jgi:hypothetical protein
MTLLQRPSNMYSTLLRCRALKRLEYRPVACIGMYRYIIHSLAQPSYTSFGCSCVGKTVIYIYIYIDIYIYIARERERETEAQMECVTRVAACLSP